MKIKLKLTLALSFLFMLIVLLAAVSVFYLRSLERDSRIVVKDNYRTLTYMYKLNIQLDKVQQILLDRNNTTGTREALHEVLKEFGLALEEQKDNITEPGEQELTNQLQSSYQELQRMLGEVVIDGEHIQYLRTEIQPLISRMEGIVNKIYGLNQATIAQRNQEASDTSGKAMSFVMAAAGVGVIIGLLFTLGIPAYIARPIKSFAKAIREVSNGNYQYKLPIRSVDEFGNLALAYNKMAAKLQEYEHSNMASVLYEKKRLDSVIDHINEALIGFDENKYVIFVNSYALHLLELNREDMVGLYAPDVARQNPLFHEIIGELMIGFEDWEDQKKFRSVNITENGQEKLFSKNIVDILEDDTVETRKVLIGHIIILMDVTEYAERDIARSQFITTLSHDLQTPIRKIEQSAEHFQHISADSLTKEETEILEDIRENSDKIKNIVKENFDLDNIDEGKMHVHVSPEDPRQLIDQSIENVKYHIQGKELKLDYQVDPELPMVNVDANKLVWVINMMLTHAIRSSAVGTEMKIQADESDGFVRIMVVDFGRPIPSEERDRAFRKFSRINGQKRERTGLGLVISKEFIEAMGGQVGIASLDKENQLWLKVPVY